MFDIIKCEYNLPEGYEFLQEESFQTKCLGGTLDTYVITKEGRLLHNKKYYEPDPSQKKDLQTPGGGNITVPGYKTVYETDVDEDHHGDIVIYTSPEKCDDGTFEWFEWFEFTIRFTRGTVESVQRRNVGSDFFDVMPLE